MFVVIYQPLPIAVLALFRNNRLTTIFLLIVYAVAVRAIALLGWAGPPAAVDQAGVLYEPLFGWLPAAGMWSAGLALVLVLVQAVQANFIADEFRITGDRTWLPGLFYVLFASALPEFLFLSPPLVAATFVLPALRRIFRSYKQPDASVLVFDAGFWLTVAGLFYPPAWWLLPAAFFGLGTMRAFKPREKIVLAVAVVVPVLLAWLWYFWMDRGGAFWHLQFDRLFGWFRLERIASGREWAKLSLVVALVLLTLFSFNLYLRKKLINVQKCISVLYTFMLLAGLSVILGGAPRPEDALLIAPSMAIFLAMTSLSQRNRLIAEIVHLVLLGMVIFIQFYPA
jgi:hypothetical protein